MIINLFIGVLSILGVVGVYLAVTPIDTKPLGAQKPAHETVQLAHRKDAAPKDV